MRTILQDAKYAARRLRRSLGFTLVAVTTLALGIGATTAIFSVIHGVLLEPLDYRNPDRLVVVYTDLPKIGWFKTWISGPEFLDLRTRTDVFEQIAISGGGGSVTLTGDGEARQATVSRISWEMLPLLGVRPILGRAPTEEEDTPNGPHVALLSYAYWKDRFGADEDAVGRILTIDGTPTEIVGVLPRGFSLELPADTMKPRTADLWLPAQVDYAAWDRHSHGLTPMARLAPGVSVEQARAAMTAFGEQLNAQYYEPTTGFALHVYSLQPDLVHKARPALLALFGAVGFVLLIACANVANLLLARSAAREKELGLCRALGAGRARIVVQILTESALLAAFGGAAGLLLAFGGVRLLQALGPEDLPRLAAVHVDGTTLAFTAATTLLTVLLFGLAPALRAASGRGLERILRTGGRSSVTASARGRLRGGLVVGEIALSLVLLVGAGLMVRSFSALYRVEPGFDPAHLLTFRVNLPRSAYDMGDRPAFFSELENQLSALPGVEAVGAVSHLPLSGTGWSGPQTFFDTTNGAPDNQDFFEVDLRAVTPSYFDTMGIGMLEGRPFDSRDSLHAETRVAIIDENLAQRVWPGVDPIGKRYGVGANPSPNNRVEVIGVVRHTLQHELDADGREQIYYPHTQAPFGSLYLVVRAQGDPMRLAGAVRTTLRSIDPDVPAYHLQTMDDYVSEALAPARFNLVLLATFALLGLVLSSIGIYGVIAYTVSLRTQELGIRKALGAQRVQLLQQVLGLGAKLAIGGTVLGLAGAFALTRFLRSLLFAVGTIDARTFATVAVLLVCVSLLACYVPSRRASRVDPAITLREG